MGLFPKAEFKATCLMQWGQRPASWAGAEQGSAESYFIWGYYGTQYRGRLYPPFGDSIVYKEYNLTRFNHQKTLLSCGYDYMPLLMFLFVNFLFLKYVPRKNSGLVDYCLDF